ncbi:MAG: PTS sugar transporter subunit IIA [Candidatus Edwardsbacteria bacterium]|nr:PTS sugar transporter subunit IIA [Candidatus Edwardsbacteria bacterium]
MAIKLFNLIDESLVIPELASQDADSVLRELIARAFGSKKLSAMETAEEMRDMVPGVGSQMGRNIIQRGETELFDRIKYRESLGTTGIGEGVAIPHARNQLVKEMVLLLGRSKNGVDFSSLDGKPVHIFFLLLIPQEEKVKNLAVLAEIARMVKKPGFIAQLLEAPDAKALYKALKKAEE